MNECAIYEEDHPVGRLNWHSDGLRWHFQARMRTCTGVRYLYLLDGQGHALRLGVPEPSGDGMQLRRVLTRQGRGGLIPDAGCRAQLREGDAPPQTEEPCTEQEASTLQAGEKPADIAAVQLRLCHEGGQLYVGERFVPGAPLQLHTLFQKMETRDIDGELYVVVPLG